MTVLSIKTIMKNFFFILLFFSCFPIFSQGKPDPVYYLNSNIIDIKKVYLNPRRIDSIWIDKNIPGGKIFLFTKQRKFTYLNLNDILKKYAKLDMQKNSMLFKINGSLIEDVSDIKIDDTYFIYVKTDSLSKVKYVGKKFRALILVSIDLDKAERKPEIYIRGNQDFMKQITN